ncbi:hypothetical protein L934_02600 [Helicobacter pylori PZ5080]|uniref:Uncharacterized protein n=1 Tax=Helicobacter pylori PZ5080 TaxID=1337394 RepID=T2STJ6_HELPX|nr:hypothetical protein L934_02600 [Helicobacter pylori PZ5080]
MIFKNGVLVASFNRFRFYFMVVKGLGGVL